VEAPVQAVVVENPDSTGNTTAPSDDPGWDNMGRVGIVVNSQVVPALYGTESYIGSGYSSSGQWVGFVLTANHVDTGTYSIFDGTPYKIVANSAVQIKDPSNNAIDLKVFEILGTDSNSTALPSLPRLNLAWSSPAAGATVTMIGAGYGASSTTPSLFNANYSTNTLVPTSGPTYDAAGYYWANDGVMRWGTTQISSAASGGTFSTEFRASTGMDATGATGDSGGLAFYKTSSGAWVAAGVPVSITTGYDPSLSGYVTPITNFSSFGTTTNFEDVSTYRNEILNLAPIPGDANHDGIVNSQDLALVSSDWLHSVTPGTNGDVNYDGIVNGQDIALISSNWLAGSAGYGAGGSVIATRVPEPATFVSLAMGAATLVFISVRKSRRPSRMV
jgi:hypothetical protein